MSSLIIPPIECAEEGCTAADKNAFYCSGCQYAHLPWFEAGADLAGGKDQTSYPEPAAGGVIPMDIMNKELLERIERALGFKLYEWQKHYILGRLNTSPCGRLQGKTTAHILRQLFAMPTPLYLPTDIRLLKCVVDEHHTTQYYRIYREMALEIAERLLSNERIITRPIITELDYSQRRSGTSL